jgi:threonine dehydrogenase-like Zn-dependent dehydrogenase
MKAIVNTAAGRMEWLDVPTPQPGAGQVRIRTAACGICATDLEMIKGWDRTGFPAIPGHEWAGVVDAVGSASDAALVGKACVADNVWSDNGEVGFEHAGGYGQYFLTEAGLVQTLPDDFPLWTATLIEPLAVCVRAMRRLRAEPCRSALVLGDGPIGLLMLLLLKRSGAEQVVVAGGRPTRLKLAKELGATTVLNYHDSGDFTNRLGSLGEAPFAAVIEAAGSGEAMSAAMNVAPRGGKILVVGDYGSTKADFPWNQVLHTELELIGSNASAGAWPQAVHLAVTRALPLERLISKRLSASAFGQALDLTRNDRDIVKVVIEWDGQP